MPDIEAFPAAAASVVNYGIPPLSGRTGLDPPSGRGDLEVAIRRFEPRLRAGTVKVRPAPRPRPATPIAFDIEAELWAEPVPLRLLLRTLIDLEDGAASVRPAESALMDRRFLGYYETELRFLRDLGGEFAAAHPAIAGRLALDPNSCADPYVERLLEGVAFLAARVQLKLDAEFPRFTEHLLDMLFPDFLAPTPSMAIVNLVPDLAPAISPPATGSPPARA